MHGLINTAIEAFARQTYGTAFWMGVTDRVQLGTAEFEAMLHYDDDVTHAVISAIAATLDRTEDHVFEDLGTFLVASPSLTAIRRLLRFGGVTYVDFLYSLEELPDRVRLAVDDLCLPALRITQHSGREFELFCAPGLRGYGHVMLGVLRSMADDYGSLALLDHRPRRDGGDVITIHIVEDAFSTGKAFVLGGENA